MIDTLFFNGDILDPIAAIPPGSDAIAVRNGRIVAVGPGEALSSHTTAQTERIDLDGNTILPGFMDTHLHFRALAESLVNIPLHVRTGIRSIADIVDRISREAETQPSGSWIRAAGYDETNLVEKRHPDRHDLDKVSPDHPVKLTHRSGHAHVLNSRALSVAGIDRETDDPPEGIIDRNPRTGEPTGVVWGLNAFLSRRIPEINGSTLDRGVALAEEKLLSRGITAFQDASPRNDRKRWGWYERLKKENRLKPRTTLMLGMDGFEQHKQDPFPTGIDETELSLRGVKIVIDETTGAIYPEPAEIKAMVETVHRSGCQAALHAIEPPAIEAAVEAIACVVDRYPRKDHRHRIEHCSVCPPALVNKIGELGITVVTHPEFVFFNGDRYLATVPKKQQPFLYPVGSLLKAGIPVAAASDAPIVDVSPLMGLYSVVTRFSQGGKPVLRSEAISPADAVRMVTLYPAMAAFQEQARGTIAPGKLADFTVLSGNPLHIPVEEIKTLQVLMTIIHGKCVWIRKDR